MRHEHSGYGRRKNAAVLAESIGNPGRPWSRHDHLGKGKFPMLSSYPVACPQANCGWTGSLMPSLLRGEPDAEIVSIHRAWFRCPRCQADWEVRITDDRVTVLPAVERGG